MVDTKPILQARNLTLRYNSASPVIRDLTVDLPRAQFTALIGPNGCGKSTLLRGLAKLHTPQAGAVLLDKVLLKSLSQRSAARQIASLAQGAQAPAGLTVSDLVRQGRYPHRGLLSAWSKEDSVAVDRALALTSLQSLRDENLDALSGGQRQRAWIAMTLAQEGRVLLLDEPTTYLDLAHQIEVLNLLRELIANQNTTVVAVLHDINQAARYADHVVAMKGGEIVAEGAPPTVLTADLIDRVFGVKVGILRDPETDKPVVVPRA